MDEIARNAEYTKRVNRQNIIRSLRRAPMSRIALAQKTGLTRAAITVITRELLEAGILAEEAAASPVRRGKVPIPLSVNPAAVCAVGVFWNRACCRIGLCDFSGRVLEETTLVMEAPKDLASLADAIRALAAHAPAPVAGVGIGAPGPLDAEGGVILNPPNFERWHNTPVVSRLRDALDLPVLLENDACVLTLYHLEKGESTDFLLLLVNHGIGSGIVSGGRLLVSRGHNTGEVGHTTICFNGRMCSCGNRGCLEAYASVPHLLAGSPYASWQALVDDGGTALLEREADYLSAAIVNVRQLVSIDTVYLAGDLRTGVELLAPRIVRRVERRSLLAAPLRVLPAFSLAEIGVPAAADLAFEQWIRQTV